MCLCWQLGVSQVSGFERCWHIEAKIPVPRRRGLLAALALPRGSLVSGGDAVCPRGMGRDIPMQVGQPVQLAVLVPCAHKAEGFWTVPSPGLSEMSQHCQNLSPLPEHDLKIEPLWPPSSESERLLPCSRAGGFAVGCPQVRPGDPGARASVPSWGGGAVVPARSGTGAARP